MTRSLLPVAFCMAVAAAASRPAAAIPSFTGGLQDEPDARAAAQHLVKLRMAEARCAWGEVEMYASWAMGSARPGSDPWLAAVAALTRARYERWAPDGSLALVREAMARATDRELNGPHGLGRELGTLTPESQALVCEIGILAARELQGRGDHEAAMFYLRDVLDRVREAPGEDRDRLFAQAMLDSARSSMSLGRAGESLNFLRHLRERSASQLEGAIATVLLQQGPEGVDAYRGRYQGDPAHRARLQQLVAAAPSARVRVARRFGLDERGLEDVAVGVADQPAIQGNLGAITLGDPRRRAFPPVVVVFSQVLAIGYLDMESMLVHELCHAALIEELGLACESLPGWVVEGIPQFVAGQWEDVADSILAQRAMEDPAGFGSPAFWVEHPLPLESDPCGNPASPAVGLALWGLTDEFSRQRPLEIVDLLRRGGGVEETLRQVFGQEPEECLRQARAEVERRLDERRHAAWPDIEALVRARERGPEAGVECSERILAGKPTRLARGLALWDRARALEAQGRVEQAMAAFDELASGRSDQPIYIEGALLGRARCLLALGRLAEAERELASLARDAMVSEVAAWASEQLLELRREKAK